MSQAHKRLPLTSLRSFEAAARLLSFKAAAEELSVTPTSVSIQIRQLEKDWGCQLFVRQTRKVLLTDAGRSLASVIGRAFSDIRAEVENHISTNRKTVTLAVGPIFGSHWLIPRLSKFHHLHPKIELVLHQGPRITNAEQLKTMIAVDWGNGDWAGLESQKLFPVHYAPVVSPKLLEEFGPIREPADLARFPVIHQWDREEWNAWLKLAGNADIEFMQEIVMRDSNLSLQAAIAGQGVLLGTFPFIRNEVDSGQLIRPLKLILVPNRAYHLLTRPGGRASEPVNDVCSWIEAEAALTN